MAVAKSRTTIRKWVPEKDDQVSHSQEMLPVNCPTRLNDISIIVWLALSKPPRLLQIMQCFWPTLVVKLLLLHHLHIAEHFAITSTDTLVVIVIWCTPKRVE